jgi:hypothetical protein
LIVDLPQYSNVLKGANCYFAVLILCVEESVMLITNLLSSDYGLMSLAVILFVIGMSVWFYGFFKRKMDEDAANAKPKR